MSVLSEEEYRRALGNAAEVFQASNKRQEFMITLGRPLEQYFSANTPNERNAIANEIAANNPVLGQVLSNPLVVQAIQERDPNKIRESISGVASAVGTDPETMMRFINPFIPAHVRAASGITTQAIDALGNLADVYAERFPRESMVHRSLKTISRNKKAIAYTATGGLTLYGLSQAIGNLVSGIRNLFSSSETVIPPTIYNIGAGETHSTIGEYLNDFIKVINSADLYKNDSLAIQSLIKSNTGQNVNPSQNELELNILSLLKRRLIDTIQSTEPISDFTTASMKNRALQIAPIHPRNQGYPPRVI
jgi:hypothetical protein